MIENENSIHEIELKIESCLQQENVSDIKIKNLVSDIADLFVKSAASTFDYRKNKQTKGDEKQKPWFTKNCDKKRRDFNKARKKYAWVKNDINKEILNAKAKEYRKEVNISYSQYQRKCEDDIRRISKTDTLENFK